MISTEFQALGTVHEKTVPSHTLTLRGSTWLNTDSMSPVYGIQARVSPRKWLNISRDGRPLIFETEAERDTELKEMQRIK